MELASREFLYLHRGRWSEHIRRMYGASEVVVAGLPLDYESVYELRSRANRVVIIADKLGTKIPTNRSIQVLSLVQYVNQDPISETIADVVNVIDSGNLPGKSEYEDVVSVAKFGLPASILTEVMEHIALSDHLQGYPHQELVKHIVQLYR